MMNGVAKRLIGAFVVGGCVGLVSQALYLLFQLVLGEGAPLAMPLTMVGLSIFGGILVITGVYGWMTKNRLEEPGVNFTGYINALASLYQMAYSKGGRGAAVKLCLKLFAFILVLAPCLAVLIGVLSHIAGMGV